MKTYRNLYHSLCSIENLGLAFRKARKRKTLKPYVMDFEADLETNLLQLRHELITQSYAPQPLKNFTVRDPKTRKISASDFRDRVIHHAWCNIVEPIFEPRFIYDNFANRKTKGTHNAILRYEQFQRKVGPHGYAFKSDIRHYFDTINHEILIKIVNERIKDERVIWLLKQILANHPQETPGKGMPLGNLTSQFLAGVYLDKLDQFVKHKLRAKYYIRYVDDFVILHKDVRQLQEWRQKIDQFLKTELDLELHPDKSKIVPVRGGVTFLGFRIFRHYRLLKLSNQRRIWKRIAKMKANVLSKRLSFDRVILSIEGWIAYAKFACTFNLRSMVIVSVVFQEPGQSADTEDEGWEQTWEQEVD